MLWQSQHVENAHRQACQLVVVKIPRMRYRCVFYLVNLPQIMVPDLSIVAKSE